MSVKKRATRRLAWSPLLRITASNPWAWEAFWGDPNEALRAWNVLKGHLRGNPTTRPTIFWHYEADDPTLAAPVATLTAFRARERARLEWLASHPDHLRPGELPLVKAALASFDHHRGATA